MRRLWLTSGLPTAVLAAGLMFGWPAGGFAAATGWVGDNHAAARLITATEATGPAAGAYAAATGSVAAATDAVADRGSCRGKGQRYLRGVSGSILRHLVLLFAAAAFVLATALPNSVSAMAGPAETPCRNCPDKAPAGSDLGKMACGALACAGVAIGLPVRYAPYLPAFATLAYSLNTAPEIIGAPPVPDPYPPRPIALG